MKNQARWVAQFLADMATLHARTGDSRFSVILVDFESEDMDVEQALRVSRLPRYGCRTLPRLWGPACSPSQGGGFSHPQGSVPVPSPQVPIPEENRKLRALGRVASWRGRRGGTQAG